MSLLACTPRVGPPELAPGHPTKYMTLTQALPFALFSFLIPPHSTVPLHSLTYISPNSYVLKLGTREATMSGKQSLPSSCSPHFREKHSPKYQGEMVMVTNNHCGLC